MKKVLFEVRPLVSLGPVLLGSTRAEARAAMLAAGFPLERSRGAMDYFCRNSFQTESGNDDRVLFIGASYHDAVTVQYRGTNVFDIAAEDLFESVASADDSGPHQFEAGEYCFPNQIVTLWAADEQYDPFRRGSRNVWAQIGVGNATYKAAIEALRHDA